MKQIRVIWCYVPYELCNDPYQKSIVKETNVEEIKGEKDSTLDQSREFKPLYVLGQADLLIGRLLFQIKICFGLSWLLYN